MQGAPGASRGFRRAWSGFALQCSWLLLLIALPRLIERLHGDRGQERGHENPHRADADGESATTQRLWRQIAVTDGEARHEGKVDGILYPPALDETDGEPESDDDHEHCGQNRPDNLQLCTQAPKKTASQCASRMSVHWSPPGMCCMSVPAQAARRRCATRPLEDPR